jgi:NAD(P)-dependent dehydrogenase (short-subunit alcohol dehydrogenase family)
MALSGKIMLITGGTRGIGRAALVRFIEKKAKVAFCARGERAGREIEDEVRKGGGEVLFFPLDIASEPEVSKMVEVVRGRWGGIDLLINNAGLLGPMSTIENYPPADWEEVIRVNVVGTFVVTRSVLPTMRAADRGRIIFITSSLGRKGRAGWGGYAVSKFAMEGLMQTLADETKGSGIRVMALNPGATRTAMRAAAYPNEDPNRLKAPSEVAEVLCDLAERDDPSLHGRSLDFEEVRRWMSNEKR